MTAELAEEIAQLRDLFQRRLFEDRRRQELYDRLYQELDFARSDLVRQFMAPLYRELLLILDRLPDLRAGSGDDSLATVETELSEVLARRGVRGFITVGEPFDPRLHEAVEVSDLSELDTAGPGEVVVGERRPGYLMEDWVLRPAQVVIGRSR